MRLSPSSQYRHARLGDCGEIVTGSTPSKAKPQFWDGEIPFVTPAQLGLRKSITTAGEFVTTDGAKQGRMLPEGSVLVCCIGSLGKTGVAGVPLITNQQINAIVFDSHKVEPRYGYYAASNLTPLLEHYAPSTTVKIVKKSTFANLEIPLPPLAEQKRIAAILDAADALRAKRRESLAQLDTLIQSTFLDMFGDPALNTKKLPTAELGDLGEWRSGGTPPRQRKDYFVGTIPWFSSGELEEMYVSESAEHITQSAIKETSAKVVPAGALMLGMYDTAALKAALAAVDCSCNQAVAFSLLRREMCSTEFVYHAITIGKEQFRRLQRGVRQKNLNLTMVRAIRIPLPPVDLQRCFSTIVESVEKQKARLRAHLAELDTLFSSLQWRAFNGDL